MQGFAPPWTKLCESDPRVALAYYSAYSAWIASQSAHGFLNERAGGGSGVSRAVADLAPVGDSLPGVSEMLAGVPGSSSGCETTAPVGDGPRSGRGERVRGEVVISGTTAPVGDGSMGSSGVVSLASLAPVGDNRERGRKRDGTVCAPVGEPVPPCGGLVGSSGVPAGRSWESESWESSGEEVSVGRKRRRGVRSGRSVRARLEAALGPSATDAIAVKLRTFLSAVRGRDLETARAVVAEVAEVVEVVGVVDVEREGMKFAGLVNDICRSEGWAMDFLLPLFGPVLERGFACAGSPGLSEGKLQRVETVVFKPAVVGGVVVHRTVEEVSGSTNVKLLDPHIEWRDGAWFCKHCPVKPFASREKVMKHVMHHIRPWVCQCQRAFGLLKDLERHLAVCGSASVVRAVHSCGACDYVTARVDNLRRHRRKCRAFCAVVP